MAYPNLLDTPDINGLTLVEQQAARLEEYSRKAREEKRKHLEENRVAGEGISSTQHDNKDDELLGTNIGAWRGKSKITIEARRQRDEALHQRHVNEQEALGLGGTEATWESDNEGDHQVFP